MKGLEQTVQYDEFVQVMQLTMTPEQLMQEVFDYSMNPSWQERQVVSFAQELQFVIMSEHKAQVELTEIT